MNTNRFSTQAEAKRAAVEAIWGTAPFSRRPFVAIPAGERSIHVAADVNGDLVVFAFDNYGRMSARQADGSSKPLVIKRACA